MGAAWLAPNGCGDCESSPRSRLRPIRAVTLLITSGGRTRPS
jgi:hypothetical protein